MNGVATGWDLNCDLGEGEPKRRTAALFASITSANVACGGHAGNEASMRQCADLAARYGVRLGAHPGVAGQSGRAPTTMSPGDLAALVEDQVQAFQRAISPSGWPVHHVKLHGALYHLTETTPEHAFSYLAAVRRMNPVLRVYALAGGRVATMARSLGIDVWPEAFLDRGYGPGGALISRGQPGALLESTQTLDRLRELVAAGRLQASDGSWLTVPARTYCLHGDVRGAERVAQAVRRQLDGLSAGR